MSLVTIVRSMVCNAILLVYHVYTRVFRLHPSDSVINTPLMTDLLLVVNIHIHAHPMLLLVHRDSILMVGSPSLQRCIMMMAPMENPMSLVINYSYILCTVFHYLKATAILS
jgi:hypothetical protein